MRRVLQSYRGEPEQRDPEARANAAVLSELLLAKTNERDLMAARQMTLIQRVISAAKSGDELPILAETHFANGRVAGLQTIPPEITAGALYVVRDPRDVASEWAAESGKPVADAVEQMSDRRAVVRRGPFYEWPGTWSQNVESWTGKLPYRVGVARYEDFREKPTESFRKVIEFLGWPFDAARFEALSTNPPNHQSPSSPSQFGEQHRAIMRSFGYGDV